MQPIDRTANIPSASAETAAGCEDCSSVLTEISWVEADPYSTVNRKVEVDGGWWMGYRRLDLIKEFIIHNECTKAATLCFCFPEQKLFFHYLFYPGVCQIMLSGFSDISSSFLGIPDLQKL